VPRLKEAELRKARETMGTSNAEAQDRFGLIHAADG
jgi:hypothetical protein